MLFVGVAFVVEAEMEAVEIVSCEEGAEKAVPDGEYAAVVGVVFASDP